MTNGSPAGTRRIALFGLFGVGNIGNEASLASALAALRVVDPDAEPVVVCEVPEIVSAQHGVAAERIAMSGLVPSFGRFPRAIRIIARPVVEVARWLTAFRFVRRVDSVVVPGTGILDDFGMSPWQMPWDLYRWAVVSRLAHRPFSLLSIGAGPIEHPVSRRLARATVRGATRCTYRDDVSRTFMAGLGIHAGVESLAPDVVFALPRPPDRRTGADRRSIGIGVMAYYGWENAPEAGAETFQAYIAAMVEVTARVLALGHDVRVLVGEGTDQHAVRELISGLEGRDGNERVTVAPIDSIEALLGEIASTDAVVATRYHNVVASLMMHRPTVSIGYADKNRDLMASAGLGAYTHHVDAIDVERVVGDLVEQLEDRDRIARELAAWDGHCRLGVEEQYRQVFGTASGSATPRSSRSVGSA